MTRPSAALLAVLLALLPMSAASDGEPPAPRPPASSPAPTDQGADCDPTIAAALEEAAAEGVRQDHTVIRDTESGIKEPESIFDISCLEDMFSYPKLDIHGIPSLDGILGRIRDRVCQLGRQAWRDATGRTFDRRIWRLDTPRLPGLDIPISNPTLDVRPERLDLSPDRSPSTPDRTPRLRTPPNPADRIYDLLNPDRQS